jgi:hypothetical protein
VGAAVARAPRAPVGRQWMRGSEPTPNSTNAPVPVETKTLVSSSGQLRKIFGADFFSVLYQCVRLWFPKFSKVYRTLHFL